MKMNPNLAILILALVIAFGMFALGALLNGERINRKNDRKRIKQIEARQQEINDRIDTIYVNAVKQELQVLERIKENYEILDDLYSKKTNAVNNYKSTKKEINQQTSEIKNLQKKLFREFIFKTEQ